MRTRTLHICDKCLTEFGVKRIALHCEAGDVPDAPFAEDDEVEVLTRYDGWQPDRVCCVELAPSVEMAHSTTYQDDADDHIDQVILKCENTHTWEIYVEKQHQVSKDADGYSDCFSPDCVRLVRRPVAAETGAHLSQSPRARV